MTNALGELKGVTPLAIAKQSLLQSTNQGQLLLDVIEEVEKVEQRMDGKYQEAKELMNKVADSVVLTYEEQGEFQSLVASKSTELTRSYFKGKETNANLFLSKVGQIRMAIYRKVKKQFNVPRYASLKRIDFEEAVGLVNSLKLSDFEDYELRMTQRQKELEG